MSNTIQSVGYKITTPCSIIRDVISKVYGPEQVNLYNIELETENIIHMNVPKEQEMKNWYNIRKGNVFDAHINKIWIVKNPRVIICEITIYSHSEEQYIYSVIAKPTIRIFKAGLKKDIISNKYGYYIECNIKVKAIPYFKTGDYFLTL